MEYVRKKKKIRKISLIAALAAVLIGGLALVPSAMSSKSSPVVHAGTFERHLDGFAAAGASRVALSAKGAGRNDSRALVVRTVRKGPAVASSSVRIRGKHAAGTKYVVRAWVRATAKRPVALRVREVTGTAGAKARATRVVARPGRWTPVAVRITAVKPSSKLTLRFRAPRLPAGERILVDDLRVALASSASTPADAPTGSTGSTGSTSGEAVAAKLSNGCGITARGIPTCAQSVYVGAAHGSNTDPAELEKKVGKLGVHRTYFTSTGVDRAVKTAQADLALGRLPWISFKLPYSWSDMVAGRGDAWAKDIAKRFAALNGPVWVAFHHEPEGDGDIQLWRRMQERLAPIVRNNAPNVAFTVIMTGWNEFFGDAKYRLSEIWPRGVKVDVAGFDVYQQYGVVKDGKTTTKWTNFADYYQRISTWARSAGVAWGLAETGVTDKAAAARPSEINDTVKLMEQYGGIAYSYFDTSLNSVAPWELKTDAKIKSFAKAISTAPTLTR